MDHINDYMNFKRLVMRLCVTFDKFANDELVESWWKVLKHDAYRGVEQRVEAFIASANDKTKFPKPGQFLGAGYVSSADAARYDHAAEKSKKNWRSFIQDHPTTGPIRLKMAQASCLMASAHEGSAAYDEAQHEYFALEKMLGEKGRFAADY
jgi:hypothetical protein